eukprot:gene9661-9820_t
MQWQLLIAVGSLLACITGTTAHGGHLHLYPSTPSGSNFIRTKIATCSKWLPATGPVKYSLVDAAAAPASAAAAAMKPSVQGNLTVWAYLYKNCSLNPDVPVPTAGTCSSGGGTPFYFDPSKTPVDDAENLLWFHNYTVPKNGSVHGNGANDGAVLTAPAGKGIQSVMLVNTNTRGKGVNCQDDMPSEASTVGLNSTAKTKANEALADTAASSASNSTGGTAAKSTGSVPVVGVSAAVASAIASAVLLLAVMV